MSACENHAQSTATAIQLAARALGTDGEDGDSCLWWAVCSASAALAATTPSAAATGVGNVSGCDAATIEAWAAKVEAAKGGVRGESGPPPRSGRRSMLSGPAAAAEATAP